MGGFRDVWGIFPGFFGIPEDLISTAIKSDHPEMDVQFFLARGGNGTLAKVEQNDLETLSHTTGDDVSSNAESLHSTYLGRNV